MVVKHNISNLEEPIEINYRGLMHKSWFDVEAFTDLINSEYMDNLMHYVYQVYDNEPLFYPVKRNIFKSFEDVDLKDIKVVIFNECPPNSSQANGNGFGEYNFKDKAISIMNPTLRDVELCITKSYPSNSRMVFDRTLRDWNHQGVMVLNTCVFNTSPVGRINGENKDRQLYFRNFIREIIKIISDKLTDVIFVFTDDSQEELFSKYIDKDFHYILKTDGFTPDCTIFDDINQLLIENAKNVSDWDEVMINW